MRFHVWVSQMRTLDLEVDADDRDAAERDVRLLLSEASSSLPWLDSATIVCVGFASDIQSRAVDPAPVGRRLLSALDAASYLGIGRTTLYGLIKSGAIESTIVGRRRFVSLEQLDRFIASHAS